MKLGFRFHFVIVRPRLRHKSRESSRFKLQSINECEVLGSRGRIYIQDERGDVTVIYGPRVEIQSTG